LYPADGGFCSCGAPQVETTWPRNPESALFVRECKVAARIIQPIEAQIKMNTTAAMRCSM